MFKLYGIDNCDTCRKARKWLIKNKINFQYHDLQRQGINTKTIHKWIKQVGYETLLNRRSTTWRNLPENIKKDIDAISVVNLIVASPTILKRPILERQKIITFGFTREIQKTIGM